MNMQFNRRPVYSLPRDIKIGGIEASVVDPHNEALFAWFRLETLPAVLVHIDKHSDMGDEAKSWNPSSSWTHYVFNSTNIANFISPAILYMLVGAVYHFDPRKEFVRSFGRVDNRDLIKTPQVKEEDGKIFWAKPYMADSERLSFTDFCCDLGNSKYPMILDIDLDAFSCTDDRSENDSGIQERICLSLELITNIPKPSLITIARSQTPQAYCPPERVDLLEGIVINNLNAYYKN